MTLIKLSGKDLLNKVLDLPPVSAIYFTNSQDELSDLIHSLRWSLVFKLKTSVLAERITPKLRRAAGIAKILDAKGGDHYIRHLVNSGKRIRGDSSIANHATQIIEAYSKLEEMLSTARGKLDGEADIHVVIPFIVVQNKPVGLFDWYYEKLSSLNVYMHYPSTRSNRYITAIFVRVLNKATDRDIGEQYSYRLVSSSTGGEDDIISELRKQHAYNSRSLNSLFKDRSYTKDFWSIPNTQVVPADTQIQSHPSIMRTPLGHSIIQPEDCTIYNNDFLGTVRSIDPCSQCPNFLRRSAGNCYFMSNQCKDLTLPNKEDSTSWNSIKSKR